MRNQFWSAYFRRRVTWWQGCKLEVANLVMTDSGFNVYARRLLLGRGPAA